MKILIISGASALTLLSIFVLPFPGREAEPNPEQLIHTAFQREVRVASDELTIYARSRVAQFQEEAREAAPAAARSVALAISDFDSYFDRASMSDAEFNTEMMNVVRQTIVASFGCYVDAMASDLDQAENETRRSLLVDEVPFAASYVPQVPNDLMEKQEFFLNLRGVGPGTLKIADDIAEFTPFLGQVYGVFKIFYDPRTELMIAKSAETFFLAVLDKEATRIIHKAKSRFENSLYVAELLQDGWSEASALRKVRNNT